MTKCGSDPTRLLFEPAWKEWKKDPDGFDPVDFLVGMFEEEETSSDRFAGGD